MRGERVRLLVYRLSPQSAPPIGSRLQQRGHGAIEKTRQFYAQRPKLIATAWWRAHAKRGTSECFTRGKTLRVGQRHGRLIDV
jgi:hypothetical protein